MIEGYELDTTTIKRLAYNIKTTLIDADKNMIEALNKLMNKEKLSDDERYQLSSIVKYIFKPQKIANPIRIQEYGYRNMGFTCFYDSALAILSSLTYYVQDINLISRYSKFSKNEGLTIDKIDLPILNEAFMKRILRFDCKSLYDKCKKEIYDRFIEFCSTVRLLITLSKLLDYYDITKEDILAMSYAYFKFGEHIEPNSTIINLLKYFKKLDPYEFISYRKDDNFSNGCYIVDIYGICQACNMDKDKALEKIERKEHVYISDALNKRNEESNTINKSNIKMYVVKYEFLLEVFDAIAKIHNSLCSKITLDRRPNKQTFGLDEKNKAENKKEMENWANGIEREPDFEYPDHPQLIPYKDHKDKDKIVGYEWSFNGFKYQSLDSSTIFDLENVFEQLSESLLETVNQKLSKFYQILTENSEHNERHVKEFVDEYKKDKSKIDDVVDESKIDKSKIDINYSEQEDSAGVIALLTNLTHLCGVSPHTLICTLNGITMNDNCVIDSVYSMYDILLYKPKYFITRSPPNHVVRKIPGDEFVNIPNDKVLETLDLNDELKYQLMGIVKHTGSMNFGHYIAYIKDKNDKMYCYDDGNKKQEVDETFPSLINNDPLDTNYNAACRSYSYFDVSKDEDEDENINIKSKTGKFEFVIQGFSFGTPVYVYIRSDLLG